jgi:hypothetical protein
MVWKQIEFCPLEPNLEDSKGITNSTLSVLHLDLGTSIPIFVVHFGNSNL